MKRTLVTTALAVLLAACSGAAADVGPMESAVAAWEDRAVDSYEMTVEYECFCPGAGTWAVTVANGEVTADPVDVTGPDAARADVPTIDQLLSWAASTASQFEDVEVTMDVRDGVPMAGSVDAPRAVDEELSWEVVTFTARDET